ncbi:MAG: ATP/GTP-binding protein [Elainellaceae cyanobacterium]
MEVLRLVITGPVGVGKSTFIRSASDIEVVDTDCRATDRTAQLKQKTTTSLDFGRLQLTPNVLLHLYGTPGQARFEFMWDILIRKAHFYILLVSAHRPDELLQARRMLSFMRQRSHAPTMIGVTHMDMPDACRPEAILRALGYVDNRSLPPIIAVNANDPISVNKAIITSTRCYGTYLRSLRAARREQVPSALQIA